VLCQQSDDINASLRAWPAIFWNKEILKQVQD